MARPAINPKTIQPIESEYLLKEAISRYWKMADYLDDLADATEGRAGRFPAETELWAGSVCIKISASQAIVFALEEMKRIRIMMRELKRKLPRYATSKYDRPPRKDGRPHPVKAGGGFEKMFDD